MKKLIYKINTWLYEYHRAKMFKYHFKRLGVKKYLAYGKTKLSKKEKAYMKNDAAALYGLACYEDTDSVKR